MAEKWKDALLAKLTQQWGEEQGKALFAKYQKAFPSNYLEDNSSKIALVDIERLEQLSAENPLEIELYQAEDKTLRLRLYQFGSPMPLSDILPMLENMDLRTLDERPYEVELGSQTLWISDFSVTYTKNMTLEIDKIKNIFQDALIHIRFGQCVNDGFNKLVLGAELPWREISILRAYSKYLHQTGYQFNQVYIEKTLANHPGIARDLITFFKAKFDPAATSSATKNMETIDAKIQSSLEAVTSLDDDRTLRRLWHLIKATLRTNYFQTTAQGKFKEYISFKLKSDDVPELPLPHPLYEVFVYAPRFEGIHLRGAKVARGGIRWSDRPEDFRTEILGLMKAQKVKNAVIVPSGAKGGFVLKSPPPPTDRDAIKKEVVACYTAFISGLLDLTDNYNLKNGSVIRPPQVICYDDEDPYLVVAADKGTATFSDIANSISKQYNFWLGDAFASGGSAGYDHKKMGITARGAWESIKRHFQELHIDAKTANITVVGIGDMSGDVFGNGALYSEHIKLVAAFDHRNIFIDPNPHPKKSYDERLRLFNLPTSSWEDYDANLISAGGGIYKRSSKSIVITPEMKKLFAIEADALTPNELICALLKSPVDLLFNGGIGTYVKASTEAHAEVGDKTNEFCRVNGNELRCKVVGEGGNLGFTQLGRVEYALTGGLINTDFIDNSAGVDCSDHEVNIKILLNAEVDKGNLTEEDRNKLLFEMTDEVAKLVLEDNYNQALVMSFAALMNATDPTCATYIKELEAIGELNRVVEFLPDEKKLLDRKAAGQGLTRPELAVLLAYTKIHIKHEILKSALPEDPYLAQTLELSFPVQLHKKYHEAMKQHRLKREIIATHVSNQVVNEMGIMFVYRLETETGSHVPDVVRAQTVASHIFRAPEIQKLIESLNFKLPLKTQYELLQHLRRLMTLTTRWFLRNNRLQGDMATIIKHYRTHIDTLVNEVPRLMTGFTKNYLETLTQQFVQVGIPKETANRIAASRALYATLNVIEVATENNFDLLKTAEVYFNVGGHFHLVWFRDQIATDSREGHWNTLARLTLRDELDLLQRTLAIAIMQHDHEEAQTQTLIETWTQKHKHAVDRWEKILEMLHGSTSLEYSMFFIALRELSELVNISVN
jgi:glutamate dehydrogenase